MTESVGNVPEKRCKWERDSEPVYDTKEEALLVLNEKEKALKKSFSAEDVLTQSDQENANSIRKTREVVVKIGKLHAIFWLLIVLSGIVWSFLFAAAIFTGFGSYQVSLFGVLGTLVLAATVFSLSKDNVVLHTVEEDPEPVTP
jgi:hypothetical protein